MKFYLLIFTLVMSCTKHTKNDTIATVQKRELKSNDSILSDTHNSRIKLKYNFSTLFPSMCRITDKHIFVGDGEKIFCFAMNGKLIREINPPKEFPNFIDFDVFENKLDTKFYTIFNDTLVCFDDNLKVMYSTEGVGENIEIDKNGVGYTIVQSYDESSDNIVNKIEVIDNNGDFINSIKLSCGTVKFEIIDNLLMFHCSNNKFYTIPIEEPANLSSRLIKKLNGNVYFVGKVKDMYVFKTYNSKLKKDSLHYFDSNFDEIKVEVLKYNFEDINIQQRLDSDYLMDNPSGITYSYFNANIYLLRNESKGTYLYKIAN